MNAQFKRLERTVYDIAVDNGQKFLFLSDVHFDAMKCDRALLRRHLKQAMVDNAIVLVFGDWFDLMQGKWDPRGSYSDLRPEYKGPHLLGQRGRRFGVVPCGLSMCQIHFAGKPRNQRRKADAHVAVGPPRRIDTAPANGCRIFRVYTGPHQFWRQTKVFVVDTFSPRVWRKRAPVQRCFGG